MTLQRDLNSKLRNGRTFRKTVADMHLQTRQWCHVRKVVRSNYATASLSLYEAHWHRQETGLEHSVALNEWYK